MTMALQCLLLYGHSTFEVPKFSYRFGGLVADSDFIWGLEFCGGFFWLVDPVIEGWYHEKGYWFC